jgi:hypothetical protein
MLVFVRTLLSFTSHRIIVLSSFFGVGEGNLYDDCVHGEPR